MSLSGVGKSSMAVEIWNAIQFSTFLEIDLMLVLCIRKSYEEFRPKA